MTNTKEETQAEKVASHNGWGRFLWYTSDMSDEGKARALDCARAAGDAEAIAHLEAIL